MTVAVLDARAWRGVFLALCAFPVLVASALLDLFGQRVRADSLSAFVYRSWLGRAGKSDPRPTAWRRWAALAISLGIFIVTAYLVLGIIINLAYPLRPDSKPTDWGGPSLAGRWIAHGLGGVLFAIVTPIVCARLQRLAAVAL